MLETMTLDSHTLIIKSDNEAELPEIIDAINQKGKIDNINSFLEFASKNRIAKGEYKFNREDCYGR
jgi:U3 small nucleolar ribonucleoprotein component